MPYTLLPAKPWDVDADDVERVWENQVDDDDDDRRDGGHRGV